METLNREIFTELADVHTTSCITIYMPAHRAGQEVLQKEDILVLKNQIKEVKRKLEDKGMTSPEIEDMMEPLDALLKDSPFWRHQSDGLALFLANGKLRKFTLSISFETFNSVSNEFYLSPLMPLFTGDGKFYLLALEIEKLSFYECSRHNCREIIIDQLTPERLEEVVGFDYEEKSLQWRAGQEGQGRAIFHGQGRAKDQKKNEVQRFIREVDKGLMEILHDKKDPLVISCVEYLFPFYQEVSTYNHIFPHAITGNPSDKGVEDLHKKAWEMLAPEFDKKRKEKIQLFERFLQTERSSTSIKEVIPAAIEGKVDTLFIQNRSDLFGVYNANENEVKVKEENDAANVSLLNMAAVLVFKQGGTVYLLDREEMPYESEVNALFRY